MDGTSGRLVHLLIATSPRLLSYAAAFSPVVSHTPFHVNKRTFGKTNINMADEVAKAKEAAENYKSSDGDGAGPATVFDKLLRYVHYFFVLDCMFMLDARFISSQH